MIEEFNKKYFFDEAKDKKKDWLGDGGFGSCYRAYRNDNEEKYAIKIIDKNKLREDYKRENYEEPTEDDMKEYYDGFKKEIEYMQIMEGEKKDNVNTVKYYEYFDSPDKFIIVLELCNESLLDYFSRKKEPFSSDEIKELLLQLNNSFKIMSQKKIAHRDLSLDNILLKFDQKDPKKYTAKLTDYGVSKKLVTIKNKYSTKVGKLNFMAPEVLQIDKEKENNDGYNESCDLWSLGVMIHILYFRKPPYTAEKEAGLMKQINNLGKKAIKETDNKLLDSLLNGLLEKNPKKRLNWNSYFKHPFFEVQKEIINNLIIIKIIVRDNDKINNEFNDIYFLDNTPYMTTQICDYKENEEIKGLNDSNAELYINGEKKTFSKYFKPTEKGDYEIKIVFKNKIKDCSYMFSGCDNIKSINLSSFDSSNVTNMHYMFGKCHFVEEIILDNLNTENVTDMSHMFNKCSSLKTIKIPSSFNTKSLKNIECMFHWCEQLTNIDFGNFTIDNVTDMNGLFLRCHSLQKINLKNFNTSNVENMSHLFSECTSLKEIEIDPSKFVTGKATQMSYMFSECRNLQNINLTSFNTTKTKFLNHMFSGCESIITLDLSSFNILKESNLSQMFDEMSKIDKIIVNANSIDNFKNIFHIIESKFLVK